MKKASYTITYYANVSKEIKRMPDLQRRQVVKKIESLSNDPYANGTIKLRGSKDLYRIRSGDYRVVFQINNEELLILIIKIGHRRDVYDAKH